MSTTTEPTLASLPEQPISAGGAAREVRQGRRTHACTTCARAWRGRWRRPKPRRKRASWEARFLEAQARGFVPAGRINSAAGTDLSATLINCFVQPVGDSIARDDDGHPGIYTALTEAAETMRRGGGVGYDFSRIRPRGAWVGSTQSQRVGAGAATCACSTARARRWNRPAARRGAQMGVLRCDHPDIEEFIHAKDDGDLRNFNISVGVTDAFMQAVQDDAEVELVHRAEPGAAQKAQGAAQRADGLWVYRKAARARAVGPDHARHLRPRRAGRAVPRPHQPGQQPRVLRDDRRDQPLRRAAASRPTAAAASAPST